jgi:hypothetical protein
MGSSAPSMLVALAMKGRGHDIPPDAPALYRPAQKGAWTRKRECDEEVVAMVLGARAVVQLY